MMNDKDIKTPENTTEPAPTRTITMDVIIDEFNQWHPQPETLRIMEEHGQIKVKNTDKE